MYATRYNVHEHGSCRNIVLHTHITTVAACLGPVSKWKSILCRRQNGMWARRDLSEDVGRELEAWEDNLQDLLTTYHVRVADRDWIRRPTKRLKTYYGFYCLRSCQIQISIYVSLGFKSLTHKNVPHPQWSVRLLLIRFSIKNEHSFG